MSENPLSPENGMMLTPKSARGHVIYSSYSFMGVGAERAAGSSHLRLTQSVSAGWYSGYNENINKI